MKKTDFDLYIEEQLKDPAFAERFEKAGEAWDVALQIAALRERAGLSQKELARLRRPLLDHVAPRRRGFRRDHSRHHRAQARIQTHGAFQRQRPL